VSRLKGRVSSMGAGQKVKPVKAGRRANGTASPPGPVTSPDLGSPAPGPGMAQASRVPSSGVTGSAASPPAVMVMPLQRVIIQATSSQYVTAGMEDLTPIFTADGAAVPATAPGRWAQLRAAGRP
jgi:hypothetical protein